MNTDISKNELYITHIENVMQNYLLARTIPLCVPRKNDGFIYILSGSCKYTFLSGISFTAKQGDILYLSKNSQYSMEVYERYDYICVNFFFGNDTICESDVFSPLDSQSVENTFYHILRKHSIGDHSFSETMSLLYKIYSFAVKSLTPIYLSNGIRSKIEESKARIIANFNSAQLSVSALAKEANMSEAYFRARFKDICGTSPAKFITDRRLSHAKTLLEMNYLSLEEISERCGFSSTSYFCRVFKSNIGITAGEYKKYNAI